VQLPVHAACDFEEQGFFITEPLFDESLLRDVRREIERAWELRRRRAEGAGHVDVFAEVRPELQRLHHQSDVLAAFCQHAAFVEVARALLGPGADLLWNQSYLKAPDRAGVTAIPWHQDAYYAEIDARAYNCWVAVTRTTVENGTLVRAELPPGGALLPHVWDKKLLFFRCEMDERRAVPVVLEPGQAFVYHGRVPHRSGVNVSAEVRIAYSVAFTTPAARLSANGEAFGDRLPLLRGGERADALVAEYATAEPPRDHLPGARVIEEIEARAPAKVSELRELLRRYRTERSEALLGRVLALLPDDEEVRGDKVRARTRPEQLFDELQRVRGSDPRAARLLLQRILELEPGNALASAELARIG
jgi:ectoine hydroxylase-related dioxygenase (phytanoyl-CoA dioxygenase family)